MMIPDDLTHLRYAVTLTNVLVRRLAIAVEALRDIAAPDDQAGPGFDPDDVNGGFDSPGDARRARRALQEIANVTS